MLAKVCESGSPGSPGSPGDSWWAQRCLDDLIVSDDHTAAVFPGDLIDFTYTPPPGSLGDLTAEELGAVFVARGPGLTDDQSNVLLGVPQGAVTVVGGERRFSATKQWSVSRCSVGVDDDGNRPGDPGFEPNTPPGDRGQVQVSVSGLFPVGGVEVTLQEMVDSAFALLDPPDPPPFDHRPLDYSVTQLPTIMWIDELYWVDDYVQRDGFNFGPTFVEVTAVPFDWEFIAGDGEGMLCDGRGEDWVDGMEAGDPGVCSYTYRHSSTFEPGQVFETITAVRFLTAWETNIPGYGLNPLPPVFRETTDAHQVGEIQAIIVEPRG